MSAPPCAFTAVRSTLREHEHFDSHAVLLATFTPVGATALLRSPLDELSGTTADLAAVLGNPGEFTMNELAEEVGKATGKEVRVKHLPLPADDPKQRQPNIERAKSRLGWEPKVPLAEGLKKTAKYFAERINVGSASAA